MFSHLMVTKSPGGSTVVPPHLRFRFPGFQLPVVSRSPEAVVPPDLMSEGQQ